MEKIIDDFSRSIKKNLKGIILMVTAAFLTSIGQLFWKISQGNNIKWLIIGFSCYGIGAVLMIIAFRFGSLSVLHPLMSVGYIFAIFFGTLILHEKVSIIQYLAIFIIILGITLIGGGDV